MSLTTEARKKLDSKANVKLAYTAGGDLEYVGSSSPGTADSDHTWTIQKLIYNTGVLESVLTAGGTSEAIFAWADRETYTYS